MRAINFKASLIRSGLAAAVLLVAATASYAQQTTLGLTAAPTQAVLPDGRSVPMWGYTCGAVTVGTGTCVAANPNAGTTGLTPNWSPVVITVPYTESAPGVSNTSLTINLTNNLSFTAGAGTNSVPTS
jgi:hypothetical protein